MIRHDLADDTKIIRTFDGKRLPGEFVFVPRARDAEEGDGWLMGYILDTDAGTTALTILNAATLNDVASVEIPHAIPPGFHGNWLPA